MSPAAPTKTPEGKAIGRFLANLRGASGLSQEKLAERLGVKRREIGRWEGGYHIPNGSHFLAYVTAVGGRIEPPLPEDVPKAFNAELYSLRKEVRLALRALGYEPEEEEEAA